MCMCDCISLEECAYMVNPLPYNFVIYTILSQPTLVVVLDVKSTNINIKSANTVGQYR